MIRKSLLGQIVVFGLAVCCSLPALGLFARNQSVEPNPDSHKVIAYYFHTSTR